MHNSQTSFPQKNSGYCHCCRAATTFTIWGDWLRDTYRCDVCGSSPRQRHLNLILDQHFPQWPSSLIHESSPSNAFLSKWAANYSFSQYFPDVESGDTHDGVRCENIEALSFPDACFDLFITQDVMEHVFHPEVAFAEVMRVIKPGGAHVFTAPKHKGINKSYRRAELHGDTVVHLLPETYHGNPVGDGKALVTYDYGDDFEALASRWGGYPVTTYITRDRGLGLDGEYLELFVMRKIDV